MTRLKFDEQKQVYKNAWGGNMAIAHENGSLTDDMLKVMTDKQISVLAFSSKGKITMEKYRRPSDRKTAEAQGGLPGEEYWGVSRAHLEIEYRKKAKIPPLLSEERKADKERAGYVSLLKGYYASRNYRLGGLFSDVISRMVSKYGIFPNEVGFSEDNWEAVAEREKMEKEIA